MKNEAGFTLIEVIVSLILVGIMASVAGMGIVAGVQGYLFAKDNAAVSGKAQLAMSRLTRTFIEVLDITTVGASPTRITYNRLSGGANIQETLYLDTADNTLKIASGGNATGGDILVDHVSSLALTYNKGAANWVQGTDDFRLLSTVGVSLALTRPDGGSNVTFSTVVTPRNNGNLGGDVPPVAPNPANPGGCFVATAAFGHQDHPMVLLLREFRDRYLLPWAGGRLMVRIYYAGGPHLADLIRDRGWACTLTQWILLPFAGMAFLMLHAPLAIPLVFLLSWGAIRLFSRWFRRGQTMTAPVLANHRGSILLGLIGTMVIFSVLGAAMLSFTNSSTFSQLTSTGSTRAYYLAEGGMRYAGSQFKNAGTDEHVKDDMLESLNGHDFSMGSDGMVHLDAYPYYLKTTAMPSGMTLSTKYPGSAPPSALPTSGYLKVGNTETIPRAYTGCTVTGSTATFTMSAALSGFTAAVNNVLPVGVGPGSATTLSKNGTLTLASGAGAFPPVNGTFTIGTNLSTMGAGTAMTGLPNGLANVVFAYKTRSGSSLQGVTLSQNPAQAFTATVPANAYITLLKFVNISSRGTYTPLQASRTISYSVPIGFVSASGTGGKAKFTDTFEDLSHWNAGGTAEGELGTHAIRATAAADNSNALHVESTYTYTLLSGLYADRASLLTLDWSTTGVNMAQAWELAGHFLSYDASVKIKVADPLNKYYSAGVIVRVDASGQMYGVSYLRPNRGCSGFLCLTDNDRIPEELCPTGPANMKPLIVLWQQTSGNAVKWLAYKELTSADGVVDTSDYLTAWSTILVRLVEAGSVKLTVTSAPLINLGDTIAGAGGTGTAKVIRKINDSDGNVVLLLNNIEGTFTLPATIGAYNTNGAWGYRARDNYLQAYYSRPTAQGTANATPLDNNRLGITRLTAGGEVTWPVDDVADWAATNDAFTLVQWSSTLNLDGGDARIGAGSELNSIIRTNALPSPSSGTFAQPEVGLDTWGTHSTSIYFDDFGLQTSSPGQTQGFLPAIQQ